MWCDKAMHAACPRFSSQVIQNIGINAWMSVTRQKLVTRNLLIGTNKMQMLQLCSLINSLGKSWSWELAVQRVLGLFD